MRPDSDPYATLGVPRTASPADIKQAYRRLAQTWHPDRNANNALEAEARFKEIGAAYAAVGDGEQRSSHDARVALREAQLRAACRAAAAPTSTTSTWKSGTPQSPERGTRGRDEACVIELTFEQAWKGGSIPLRAKVEQTCRKCYGLAPVATPQVCAPCKGTGSPRAGLFSRYSSSKSTCSNCAGTGIRGWASVCCTTCKGKGTTQRLRKGTLTVRAGVVPGMVLCVAGAGGDGRDGGRTGNLLATVVFSPSSLYRLEGLNLHQIWPAAKRLYEVGGRASVKTLAGTIQVGVPVGLRAGVVLRVPGLGWRHPNTGARGDLLLHAT